jgi:hypothetical protein
MAPVPPQAFFASLTNARQKKILTFISQPEVRMNSKSVMAICLSCAVAVAIPTFSRADDASAPTPPPTDYKQLYEEQKKRSDDLEKRIGLLEQHATQDLYVVKADVPDNTVKFLKQVDISGFVSSSYTYNFNRPADRVNAGRLYDNESDQFVFNKFALIAQHNVDYDAFDWKAGFFTELILGQDARGTRSKSPDTPTGLFDIGSDGDLEQAYVQLNIPIGSGLKILFGKYVTPMGFELVENEQNPNWSGGLQWTFIEPFTHTGLQLGYKISNEWEANLLINDGWDTVKDNNQSKSVMGRLAYTPNDAWSFTLIGYGGPEQSDLQNDPTNAVVGANGLWRKGVNFVLTHKCSPKCSSTIQLDWGEESGGAPNGGAASWYAIGAWTTYDFTEKLQLAFRSDFLSDRDGNRTSGFLFPVNTGQDLWSLTWTLNYKPVDGLRIAPELRYDHSSLSTAFDGHHDQVTAALGAVYSF